MAVSAKTVRIEVRSRRYDYADRVFSQILPGCGTFSNYVYHIRRGSHVSTPSDVNDRREVD